MANLIKILNLLSLLNLPTVNLLRDLLFLVTSSGKSFSIKKCFRVTLFHLYKIESGKCKLEQTDG